MAKTADKEIQSLNLGPQSLELILRTAAEEQLTLIEAADTASGYRGVQPRSRRKGVRPCDSNFDSPGTRNWVGNIDGHYLGVFWTKGQAALAVICSPHSCAEYPHARSDAPRQRQRLDGVNSRM